MGIDVSRETEVLLSEEAKRQGISVDALVQRLMDEHARLIRPVQPRPTLPIWRLGSPGTLHRRDIYDDAG